MARDPIAAGTVQTDGNRARALDSVGYYSDIDMVAPAAGGHAIYTHPGPSVRGALKVAYWPAAAWGAFFHADHLYGPNGIIPDEDWELRRQIVLERIPKNPRHPYSSAIMFIDPQIWYDSFHVAFDHSGAEYKKLREPDA